MSHLLSALFFLAVMAASLGLIVSMLAESRERILLALAGAPRITMGPMATVNFVNFARSRSLRLPVMRSMPLRAAA